MLTHELKRETFNKAEHNRLLQRLLPARSKGSIEFKHCNISAVLIEYGFAYVDGYQPRWNYQALLRDLTLELLATAPALLKLMAAAVIAPVTGIPTINDLLAVLVEPPQRNATGRQVRETIPPRLPGSVNYLEREAHNASLGRAGEDFVMRYEHERLWRDGRRKLAARVEHVAVSKSDALGFDILSFEKGGAERWIEVKTTRFGSMTPFFASPNEVATSERNVTRYHLYRLFTLERDPRMFQLRGSLRGNFALDPSEYRASIR